VRADEARAADHEDPGVFERVRGELVCLSALSHGEGSDEVAPSVEGTVLQVFPYWLGPETGGASGVRSVIEATVELTRERWRHVVLTPAPSRFDVAFTRAGADVTSLGRKEHLVLRRTASPVGILRYVAHLAVDIPRIMRVIRRRRIDVVHSHGSAYLGAAIAGRLSRRPVIVHVHERMDMLPARHARIYRRIVGRLATRVVLIAGFLGDEWRGSGAATVLIPNTVPWIVADTPSGAAPVVGFLGRVAPRKGIEYLIRAFAIVHVELPEARLTIVGGPAEPEDYPYLERLREEVTQLGLDDVVEFRGPVEDPLRALSEFRVLGFTSPIDIAPVTVLQAMALGIPVVSASDGGADEMVVSGVTGLAVPPRDEAGIAAALLSVLRDQHVRDEMGAAARARFLARYGPARYAADVGALYQALARRPT
jgi:glycosyltransferase involved in cell wall biosynthesis